MVKTYETRNEGEMGRMNECKGRLSNHVHQVPGMVEDTKRLETSEHGLSGF